MKFKADNSRVSKAKKMSHRLFLIAAVVLPFVFGVLYNQMQLHPEITNNILFSRIIGVQLWFATLQEEIVAPIMLLFCLVVITGIFCCVLLSSRVKVSG
jgi:polyferredoxin